MILYIILLLHLHIAHVILRTCMFTCGLYIYAIQLAPSNLPVPDYIKYLTYTYYPNYIYIFTDFIIIFLTINPAPPCQLSPVGRTRTTWRKTTTFGRVLTNSSHVRSHASRFIELGWDRIRI